MTSADPSGEADPPARRPDVEWVELDGDVVLYHPTLHMLHRLNTGLPRCGRRVTESPRRMRSRT
jgi:hypothetical protein